MRELTACKRSVNRNYCDEVELELTACEEVELELTAVQVVDVEFTIVTRSRIPLSQHSSSAASLSKARQIRSPTITKNNQWLVRRSN